MTSALADLNDKKLKLDQEIDRLKFYKEQCDTLEMADHRELLKAKYSTKKNIIKKIEKYSKQEAIIYNVLSYIGD